MLRGISPLLSPALLAVMCRMGHGDELVLADAHFPGESLGLFARDPGRWLASRRLAGCHPATVRVGYLCGSSDCHDGCRARGRFGSQVEASYSGRPLTVTRPSVPPLPAWSGFAFYDRARQAFAIVMTGETAKYGNIILKKGVS